MFRCTRNRPYPENTLGHKNVQARQGYYISAISLEDALIGLGAMFPDKIESGFTVDTHTI
jgi:hypothetical protein